ncbi:phosphatidate cytidylyltransferase [Corynebacterium breve]|uniref:Phosphatidate cytidylyltransferase n=1 Tax=Corynebacterium breve TaxID=3049799 RepID=A0ABY8VI79_9CORY|nr:phosphatidate cytidylyltransferase [Corynebacterium breve]WIM69042.1 phosphatidate cytidylyltransferase [Corynebacterium breve]
MPKPKNSAGRNLPQAIGVGVFLALLVIGALITGPRGWYPLVAAAIGVAMWEVLTRLREKGYVVPRTVLLLIGQAMVWVSWPYGTEGLLFVFTIGVLLLMFGRLFHLGAATAPKNYLRDTAVGVFVLAWIPLFGAFAAMISLLSTWDVSGSLFILTFMLCVVASDTGGYFAGVMFGSHPMAPAVSPKKSWEGFGGSALFGIITGALCLQFLLQHEWWLGVILGLTLVVCATLGDLVESQFKRELGIKDMSHLLPGHGGIMDRLDGMLPAAAVTWLLLSLVGA